jgi:ABC-2 type transport system permease protein
MHTVLAVTKKELRAYFNSPIAYIFLVIFAALSGWLFFSSFFFSEQATLRGFFANLPTLFLFLLPALTMRLWAEERKAGTDELLLTMPLTQTGIVAGKFLAAFLLLLLGLLMTLPVPIIVNGLGNLDWGPVVGGYLGALFLGGAYLAMGLVISSFTENQLVALILSIIACGFFFLMGEEFILRPLPESVARVFQEASLAARFESVERGVVDSRDVVYYGLFIGFFLFVNVVTLKVRTWK